jgi:hypothetical protein
MDFLGNQRTPPRTRPTARLEIQETPTQTRPAPAASQLTPSILPDSDELVQASEDVPSSPTLPSIIADSDWIECSETDSPSEEEQNNDSTLPSIQMQSNQDLFDSHQGRFSGNNGHIPNLHGGLVAPDESLNSKCN